MALDIGTRLGHYDVTALIGEGGMGQVYQATNTKLNRQVAAKIGEDGMGEAGGDVGTSRTAVPGRQRKAAGGVTGFGLVLLSLGAAITLTACGTTDAPEAEVAQVEVPIYELDPSFPRPLPNNWTLGETWGVAVDSRDHPWILHSTNHHARFPPGQMGDIFEVIAQEGKTQAPPVIEFDQEGNLVQAWGGPGDGYSWPEGLDWAEHGLWIDRNDDVWVAGNGHVVLKFTNAGEFLLQIGKLWQTGGSYDRELLGKPATMSTDQDAKEVYIADGYFNQRVAVFDATTGAYKRQFGAYGKPIDVAFDGWEECESHTAADCAYNQHNSTRVGTLDPPPDHLSPVHCARVSNDGFVYVCDRYHNRIQVFKTDGTYVDEVFLDKDVGARWEWDFEAKEFIPYPVRPEDAAGEYGRRGRYGIGSTSNAALSRDPENKYLIVSGSPSYRRIYILERKTLRVLASFDTEGSGHEVAVDSQLNIYTVGGRPRDVRKLVFKGMRPVE